MKRRGFFSMNAKSCRQSGFVCLVAFVLIRLVCQPVAAAERSTLQVTDDGRRTVAAAETRTPITLDGALDEPVWREAEPAAGFVQAEPHEGEPASEATEVRLAFDRDALYVAV